MLFMLAFFLLGQLSFSAQADLTGFWVLRVPTGDGNDHEIFFNLKQTSKTVTGKVLTGFGDLPLSEGTFKNGNLHLVVTFRFENQQHQVTYDGAMEGDKLAMTTRFPGREPLSGTAERTKPEAALPPPRLPLPELHDVAE